MLLTITTTHRPATDIGYLLHKNPNRCQYLSLPFGKVNVFYPEAKEKRCTVAVLIDINPIEIIRGHRRKNTSMQLEHYVNDRPYVCSSFMSVAIARVFGDALNGKCKQRPGLVSTVMPLTCSLSVLPCRGGEVFLRMLFEPLGYELKAEKKELDSKFPQWGDSSYFKVELKKETTVTELLNHLYVLIPVLDNQKHYYIDKAEIDKLLKRGEGWLADHPKKENIAKRYLKFQSSYAREALKRLLEENPAEDVGSSEETPDTEEVIERKINLNEERMGTVLAAIKACGAKTVIDLGCGEGKLLKLLLKEKQFKKITGMDVSIRSLEIAAERLYIDNMSPKQRERIDLLHGSLMYRDRRIEDYDAAAIVEVIEHLDQPRLKAFERVVFEFAKPKTVIITTPNIEYNAKFENLPKGKLRHNDHRFEWTRKEFRSWSEAISKKFGYAVRYLSVGEEDKKLGAPSQMGIFTRE